MEARISTERHVQRQQKLKEQVDTRRGGDREKRDFDCFHRQWQREIHCRVWYCDARGGSWQNGGVAQYIKGQWDNGEYNLLQPLGVEFHIMGTGFTSRHRTGKRISTLRKRSGRKANGCWLTSVTT